MLDEFRAPLIPAPHQIAVARPALGARKIRRLEGGPESGLRVSECGYPGLGGNAITGVVRSRLLPGQNAWSQPVSVGAPKLNQVDIARIKVELQTWLKLADRLEEIRYSSYTSANIERIDLVNELFDRHISTLKIVRRVLNNPQIPNIVKREYSKIQDPKRVETIPGATLVRQALGSLDRSADITKALGSTAPTLSADKLHTSVWAPASTLWASGHHGMAVQRAATNLSGHVQDLIGRYDLNDAALMQEAFSSAPPKQSRPRLRWPGDPAALTVKAMNDGIRAFSVGCFQAIRNPLTHSVDEIPKQVALEQLSALSVLARWVDECEKLEESADER
ncbi:hypothetical protein D8W71_12365 [Rhodococcus sp. P1Y]|nr:hypothetical protein D8W71_12365 [Rhodococcus sp. P1Y]